MVVTGNPTLLLETGAVDRVANHVGTLGSVVTFWYDIQEGDASSDLDYASSSALSLNGGTIEGQALGFPALTLLPSPGAARSLGAAANLVIDGLCPTLTSIALVGSPAPNATTVSYALTFSEPVTGFDVTDLTLLTVGSASGSITQVTGGPSAYTVTVSSISGSGALPAPPPRAAPGPLPSPRS